METQHILECEIVEFKSQPEEYNKESSDLKNNTIRIIDYIDSRFYRLASGKAKYIRITNTETKECFTRRIRDYSIFKTLKSSIGIITWYPLEIYNSENKIPKENLRIALEDTFKGSHKDVMEKLIASGLFTPMGAIKQ